MFMEDLSKHHWHIFLHLVSLDNVLQMFTIQESPCQTHPQAQVPPQVPPLICYSLQAWFALWALHNLASPSPFFTFLFLVIFPSPPLLYIKIERPLWDGGHSDRDTTVFQMIIFYLLSSFILYLHDMPVPCKCCIIVIFSVLWCRCHLLVLCL